jgi:hypothetical protein
MSETIIFGISPTFYLKQIFPLLFTQKYLNGDFKHIDINFLKINHKKSAINISQQVEIIGNSPLSKMFTLVDRNNNSFTCVTTNNFSDEAKETICQWCRCNFSHSWIGIPYRLEVTENNSIYYTDGRYCCFECCFADLTYQSNRRFNRFHGQYVSADILLEQLHERIYPNTKLYPSPHFSLHERNGGALPDKDYYSQRSIFIETTGIIILPTKRISIQLPYL